MRPGARPRVLLWPGPFHPGPQYGNPDHATQRSGKRRHLRQQEAEMLSGDLLLGKRRIPPVTRLHRKAGGAQGARSIRIAQGTVNKLGGGALRGSARVRAALLHSGRPSSRPTDAPKDRYSIAGRRRTASRPTEGRGPAQRAAAATEATAGGSRSAARPGADHEDPPSNSTTRPPPRASAHAPPRAPPHTGRGAQPLSAPRVSTGHSPPARRGGAAPCPYSSALAIKQLTTAVGPHAGARSSFHGVPDSQQRDARAPAAAPTAARRTPAITDRQYRHPLAEERTQPENSLRTSQAAD